MHAGLQLHLLPDGVRVLSDHQPILRLLPLCLFIDDVVHSLGAHVPGLPCGGDPYDGAVEPDPEERITVEDDLVDVVRFGRRRHH